MIFAEEKITDEFLKDIEPLNNLHWEEIALNKDKIKLSPDKEKYKLLSELDVIKCYTMRDSGELVGYSIYIVQPHLHYSQNIYAVNDILFLLPKYRKGKNAIKFLQYCDEQLYDVGVDVICIHMKVEHSFESLCEYLGYKKTEYLYSKYIGE